MTEAWLHAQDRRAISSAADQIDLELADDPDEKGEGLGESRILIVPPLTIAFWVSPADRRVEVLRVVCRR